MMMPHRLLVRALALSLLAVLALAGCETVPPPAKVPDEAPATAREAEIAESSGEYVRAAHEFERLAQAAVPPQRQHYLLKSVELYLKAAQISEARKKLAQIDIKGLDAGFDVRKRILESRLANFEGDYAKAIILLDGAARVRGIAPDLSAEIYVIRAEANLALERPFNAAGDLIERERFLVDPRQLEANQQQIWKLLSSLPRAELAARKEKVVDDVWRGWIDLAIVGLEHARNPRGLPLAIDQWREKYRNHPIRPEVLAAIGSRKPTLLGRVDRIALLLPLTSRHGRAAQAVHDGFLAMSAANRNPDKPVVTVYDFGDDPARAPEFYKRAVSEGAQLVVGPLGLEAVEAVVDKSDLTVPTLLLSHTQKRIEPAHVFQFGLPPEQEAQQAAERAYLDGHRQAAVLYPDSAWGKRMLEAFADHWGRLGGIMIKAQPYGAELEDFSDPIRDLLNVTQSIARKDAIEGVIRERVNLEPRARQDIDFVFVAANAKQGRLIKPQLNFHQGARLPVYATSHVYFGKPDAAKDTDLEDVVFGDMPWMLLSTPRMEQLRATLQPNWPMAYTPFDRLFALGVDSYAIVPHLNRIAGQQGTRFNGVSSGLSIDVQGRLHRQLLWARFRRGVPRILDTFMQYRESLDLGDGTDATTPARRQRG
jgi:outer membrane PBP1 activator LpoA protein